MHNNTELSVEHLHHPKNVNVCVYVCVFEPMAWF